MTANVEKFKEEDATPSEKAARYKNFAPDATSLDKDSIVHHFFEDRNNLLTRKAKLGDDADKQIKESPIRILRYFCCHGEIAHDCVHEGPTLHAIQNNVERLTEVAGDRIWVEMRKLLSGGNVINELRVMYEIGVAEKIGMPNYGFSRLEQTEKVCKRTQNPITILVSIIHDSSVFAELACHWCLGRKDKNLARYLLTFQSNQLRFDLLVCALVMGNPRSHVVELVRIQGSAELEEELAAWSMPSFPLTDKDIWVPVGCNKRKNELVNMLKLRWGLSCCKLTREELLEMMPILAFLPFF